MRLTIRSHLVKHRMAIVNEYTQEFKTTKIFLLMITVFKRKTVIEKFVMCHNCYIKIILYIIKKKVQLISGVCPIASQSALRQLLERKQHVYILLRYQFIFYDCFCMYPKKIVAMVLSFCCTQLFLLMAVNKN